MLKPKRQVGSVTNKDQLAVFQALVTLRTDVPNVLYFDLVEFLLQGLELKLELSHLVLLTEFGTYAGKLF